MTSPANRPGLLLRRVLSCSALLLLLKLPATSQTAQTVNIRVDVGKTAGPLPPAWNYFGYDEPNYSYAENGKKLLGELAALSPVPVYVRVHNLLTTGDGSASLKWGSTNAYTEDSAGNPIYNWDIVDRIFDTFHAAGIKPLVEIGFMPKALSTHPQPYRHTFPQIGAGDIYTGWAYPPTDYQKWSELVFEFARHLRDRYGDDELQTWLWEVWNEPDIGYWKGTPEEYFRLYDFSVEAVRRALPNARIGGPDSTGPFNPQASQFLKAFLNHCAHERNYATGNIGSRLDFISFHPKGAPKWQGDHVQMGISRQLASIDEGFKIVASFPEWRRTPIVLGESDPEGCAACSARTNPQNSYRNGPLYGCYSAEVLKNILALASRAQVSFLGAVTWAFEFEGQPYFEGFRSLATNGVDKPVLNVFRMFGLLAGEQLKVTNSGELPVEQVLRDGVRGQPDISAVATRGDHQIELLVWNYHDDDLPSSATPIDLAFDVMPASVDRVLIEHFRVDATHSNAFSVWKEIGSPQSPSPAQYQQLQDAGQLQLLGSPNWVKLDRHAFRVGFDLPRQAVSLLRITW